MVRDAASSEPQKPSAPDRARQLTKGLQGDAALDAWAAGMIKAADDFQSNKRPDPLSQFLVTHLR